jgi:hypothetical protein
MPPSLTADGKLKRPDENKGALISQDVRGLDAYKKKKAAAAAINKLEKDVSELKSDLDEIKTILRAMAGR